MPGRFRRPRLLSELLREGREDAPALVAGGDTTCYGELRARVRAAAAALAGAGLRPGERALVVLPNDAGFPVAVLAVFGAGGVIVPLDYRSPAEQIVRIARDCQAAALLCDGLVFARVEGRLREIPSLRFAVVRQVRPSTYILHVGVVPWEEAVACPGPAPELACEPRQLAALVYTSGSTGHPKGVMHSHESLISSLVYTRDELGIGPGDRVLISFPLYHLFSFRVLLVHLLAGGTAVLAPDILAGLRGAPETRPNSLILVPAACALLLQKFAPVLAACAPLFRRVGIGSAAISPELLGQLRALLPGAEIHIPYGMTEARIGFLEEVPGRAARRLRSVDPHLELRVLDDDGKPVAQGLGEVVLRGPALMIGYWHNRDSENEAIRRDGFRTRDLMEVSESGERFLVGRLDDVISVGGEKVFPSEVEAVLLGHPRVRDARVTGEPDPRGLRGQVVKAQLVLEPGAALEPEAIAAHCRSRLEPYKLPVLLEAVPEIARNDMGKVARIGPTPNPNPRRPQ
jgi:acyl-CoA synthetase (AMP-forming)/AMP-acid ligase II